MAPLASHKHGSKFLSAATKRSPRPLKLEMHILPYICSFIPPPLLRSHASASPTHTYHAAHTTLARIKMLEYPAAPTKSVLLRLRHRCTVFANKNTLKTNVR